MAPNLYNLLFNSAIRLGFLFHTNPKNLNLSCKMDPDLLDCFGREQDGSRFLRLL